jgi:hypothetical protein
MKRPNNKTKLIPNTFIEGLVLGQKLFHETDHVSPPLKFVMKLNHATVVTVVTVTVVTVTVVTVSVVIFAFGLSFSF